MVLSLQATASKSLCGREAEKGVMFISSMVLQWIMTFSSYQQNDQECMKPQFQWLECWTHVWPSMEDVNLSFFCADKRQVYPRRHWNFGWSNTFREKHKHCKTQCKINIFHIHTNKMQLASGEPPAFTLYIYIYTYECECYDDVGWCMDGATMIPQLFLYSCHDGYSFCVSPVWKRSSVGLEVDGVDQCVTTARDLSLPRGHSHKKRSFHVCQTYWPKVDMKFDTLH